MLGLYFNGAMFLLEFRHSLLRVLLNFLVGGAAFGFGNVAEFLK